MWLGTKPGLSTPWMSGILKGAEELAQFSTAPDIPPKLCPSPLTCWEPLWAAPEICCMPYRDQSWISLMAQNKSPLKQPCLIGESLFAVFFFLMRLCIKHTKFICYWNFDVMNFNVVKFWWKLQSDPDQSISIFFEVQHLFLGSSNRQPFPFSCIV